MHAETNSNNVNVQETRKEAIVPMEYIARRKANNPIPVIEVFLTDNFIYSLSSPIVYRQSCYSAY